MPGARPRSWQSWGMAGLHVEAMTDSAAALAAIRGHLDANPVELNLIWSVMKQRADLGLPGRYWVLRADGQVTGLLMESLPPHLAALSPVPGEHAAALAEAVAADGHDLLGVTSEVSAAANFTGRWSELKGTGAVVADAQRLYVLGNLVPADTVPGRLRHAVLADRPLVMDWWSQFQIETGLPHSDVAAAVDLGLRSRRLFVWDDDGARCLARATEPLGGISRIGVVFTPPSWRRRGYAAACVAALCEWLARQEGANSVLYAQLSNPGSNAIYRRLGFEAVCEVLAYRFLDLDSPPGDHKP